MDVQRKPVRIGWDVSILLLSVGLVFILGWIEYHSGLTNYASKWLPLGGILEPLLLLFLLLACFAVVIARLIYQWKAIPAWGNWARCGIIVMMFVGGIALWCTQGPGINRFAQGFNERMKRDADVKAIRTWAGGLAVHSKPELVPENLWPKCVTSLSPRRVYYAEDVAGVRLDWGGGLVEQYGLVVGPVNMEVPPTTERELIMPLEAGAYLYFDCE